FKVNILETVYLRYVLPYIVLMIVLFNLYYVIFYFYLKTKRSGASFDAMDAAAGRPKEGFIVGQGSKRILVYATDICYFFHKNGQNFLNTFGEDTWIVYEPLDMIE